MPQPNGQRVGYVVKRYPRYSETFIVNEILAHEAAGLDLDIYALRGPEDTHFQDIISRVRAPVIYLPDRLKTTEFWALLGTAGEVCPGLWRHVGEFSGADPRDVAHAAALARQVAQRGITHLHAHFATSAASVARMASRFSGVPYSLTAHAKDIFHQDVNPNELAAKLHDAASVVTVSDFNLDYLSKLFPTSADKIHRIYNGLDLSRFPYRSPGERDTTVISVGRLVEKKGIDYLIDACEMLFKRGQALRCLIVGSGELENTIRARIRASGLEDNIEMLGSRPQREVIELVQSASVFAAPCIVGDDGNRDGLPTVLLEAMALGTPCVGTDVTGIPEALIDGKTGFCIAQHDAAALADRIQDLLNDSALRERLARSAREHIERLFEVNSNAARVRGLFEQATQQNQQRHCA